MLLAAQSVTEAVVWWASPGVFALAGAVLAALLTQLVTLHLMRRDRQEKAQQLRREGLIDFIAAAQRSVSDPGSAELGIQLYSSMMRLSLLGLQDLEPAIRAYNAAAIDMHEADVDPGSDAARSLTKAFVETEGALLQAAKKHYKMLGLPKPA